MGTSRFHIPAMAAMAGIALAASGLAMSTSTDSQKKQHKRSKRYVTGLVSKNSNVNSILQALATSDALRSYLAERVDERGDELDRLEISHNAYILQSLAYALYTIIEVLNKPHSRPETAMPTEFLSALERHSKIHEDQDVYSIFQAILGALTAEEQIQYRDEPSSLMDVHPSRSRMIAMPDQDTFETGSVSSVATTCTSFSVCSPAGYMKPRQRRPKSPFQGLQATQWTCIRCSYSAPVDHTPFNCLLLENTSNEPTTIETCLEAFTRIETRMEYACRKCMLLATLDTLTQQSAKQEQQDEEALAEHLGKIQVLKDAIRYNIEASLPGIPLVRPIASTTPASKQTQIANLPQILCIRLSSGREGSSSSGKIGFSERLDLAPYTTQDQQTPRARLSRPSRIFLRNMAAGYRFVHRGSGGNGGNGGVGDGLGVALLGKEDKQAVSQQPIQNPLPSLVSGFNNGASALQSLPYKLTAVVVESQGITFRRKRLPTGHKVRRPDESGIFGKKQHHQNRQPKANTPLFWRCQDDRVDQVALDQVLKSDASMLFYERDVLYFQK